MYVFIKVFQQVHDFRISLDHSNEHECSHFRCCHIHQTNNNRHCRPPFDVPPGLPGAIIQRKHPTLRLPLPTDYTHLHTWFGYYALSALARRTYCSRSSRYMFHQPAITRAESFVSTCFCFCVDSLLHLLAPQFTILRQGRQAGRQYRMARRKRAFPPFLLIFVIFAFLWVFDFRTAD